MHTYHRGFTLTQLMIVIFVMGILSLLAIPTYKNHQKQARLREAQAALLENAQNLERFYLQNHSFKKNSTTWADLPIQSTQSFCLKLHGIARGATDGKFTLKAVAYDKNNEPRVLKLNETLNTFICQTSTSQCNDKSYFSGNDKECSVYQP